MKAIENPSIMNSFLFSTFLLVFLHQNLFVYSFNFEKLTSLEYSACFENSTDFENLSDIDLAIRNGAQPGDAPFIVFAFRRLENGTEKCTGSLISPNKVLISAHCFEAHHPSPVIVRFGTLDRSIRHYLDVKVVRIARHPRYFRFMNDIAVMTLERRIPETDSVKYAVLNPEEVQLRQMIILFGFGRLCPGERTSSTLLQKTFLKIFRIEETRFLARESDTVTCKGDSGGFAISEDGRIVGVISGGDRDATPGSYDIIVKIRPFINWINQH